MSKENGQLYGLKPTNFVGSLLNVTYKKSDVDRVLQDHSVTNDSIIAANKKLHVKVESCLSRNKNLQESIDTLTIEKNDIAKALELSENALQGATDSIATSNRKAATQSKVNKKVIANLESELAVVKDKLAKTYELNKKLLVKKAASGLKEQTAVVGKKKVPKKILTCASVKSIRKKFKEGIPQKELAVFFNTSRTTISRIVNNKTYKECLPKTKTPRVSKTARKKNNT